MRLYGGIIFDIGYIWVKNYLDYGKKDVDMGKIICYDSLPEVVVKDDVSATREGCRW